MEWNNCTFAQGTVKNLGDGNSSGFDLFAASFPPDSRYNLLVKYLCSFRRLLPGFPEMSNLSWNINNSALFIQAFGVIFLLSQHLGRLGQILIFFWALVSPVIEQISICAGVESGNNFFIFNFYRFQIIFLILN